MDSTNNSFNLTDPDYELLPPPKPDIEKKITEQMNLNAELIPELKKALREWIPTKPYIVPPPGQEELWLDRFVRGCKRDLDRIKFVMENYFDVRRTMPEFFSNRDPTASNIRENVEVTCIAVVPGHTSEGYRVLFICMTDEDSSKFHAESFLKRVLLFTDNHLNMESFLGYVVIFDMKHFAWKHYRNFTLPLIRKSLKCSTDAIPIRIKAIHFTNAPKFLNLIFFITRSALSKRVRDKFVIHRGGANDLAQYISLQLLPSDFNGVEGGSGSMDSLNRAWQQRLESAKDWFLQEENRLKEVFNSVQS